MSTIHVEIVSAEREIFSGDVEIVFAPARLGEVGILPGHAAMLTPLRPGEVRVQMVGGEQQAFYVSGGMLEVQPKVVTVLSDTAIRAHDRKPRRRSRIAPTRWISRRLMPNSPNLRRSSRRSSGFVAAAVNGK